MAGKQKYYVVWEGREPGVYDNWEDASEQIEGYSGAKFKSYPTLQAAIRAFRGEDNREASTLLHLFQRPARIINYSAFPEIDLSALAVDAACSKNPGPMEYRGVIVGTGEQVFHYGPLPAGTNNIGEYLALIHALALCKQRGDTQRIIYTDSKTALSWLRAGHSRTQIKPTPENAQVRALLQRADAWRAANPHFNPVRKWETEQWGEIPADFGRK